MIEYLSMTTDPCTTSGCRGTLHANRGYVYYRCPTCFATYTRIGAEIKPDHRDPAREPPPREQEIQYSRISTETCAVEACGGQLHSNSDALLYRCPQCHETYMRFGAQLVRDASIPRAIVIDRKKP